MPPTTMTRFSRFSKSPATSEAVFYFQEWTAYVPLVGRYVGWNGIPSPLDKIFACPADTFHDDIRGQ